MSPGIFKGGQTIETLWEHLEIVSRRHAERHAHDIALFAGLQSMQCQASKSAKKRNALKMHQENGLYLEVVISSEAGSGVV